MFWTVDNRRETEWQEWFAWYPVSIESLGSFDNKYKSAFLEKLERRSIALPNNGSRSIYRKIGSKWDHSRPKKPSAPPPSPIVIRKEEQRPPK